MAKTNCPDELVLAALVDGVLPGEELRRWRGHLAACPECRRLVADIVIDSRQPADRVVPEISPALRERVRRLVPFEGESTTPQLSILPGGGGSPNSITRGASGAPIVPARIRGPWDISRWILLAAAAGLVVAAGLRWRATPVSRGPTGADAPEMRGDPSTGFATLEPGDRAVLAITAPEALELAWRALPESVIERTGRGGVDHYEVTILDASGQPLWSTSTRDTRIYVSPGTTLEAGHTYSWTVAAHLQLGSTISTPTATFTLSR